QAAQGFFDVRPRGVLGEKGADDDLEARLCRPPVLRSPALEQGGVIAADLAFRAASAGAGTAGHRWSVRLAACGGKLREFPSGDSGKHLIPQINPAGAE